MNPVNNKISVHVMSDLHLEHRTASQNADFFEDLMAKKIGDSIPDEVEIGVLAGDITSLSPAFKDRTFAHFKKFASIYKDIVYVPGNHEFYNTSFDKGNAVLAEVQAKHPNIHVLNPGDTFTHKGLKFVGSTMWFPDPPWNANKRGLNDYWLIKPFEPMVYDLNKEFADKVIPLLDHKTFVVTHHLPFNQSIATKYKGDPFNAFFLSDCSKLVDASNAPLAWAHGHTHDATKYINPIGIQVFCNPRGYPHEGLNPDFFDNLLVKLCF